MTGVASCVRTRGRAVSYYSNWSGRFPYTRPPTGRVGWRLRVRWGCWSGWYKVWRPQRDSNPRFGLERATSWASGRWGPLVGTENNTTAVPHAWAGTHVDTAARMDEHTQPTVEMSLEALSEALDRAADDLRAAVP